MTHSIFAQNSLHQMKTETIDGKLLDFSSLKGKKVLIVNTASECGYTPQYEQLEELYQKYKDRNFVIIAFPCNDFGGQEPGTAEEIKSFCSSKFHTTFPLMAKISIKGDKPSPIYEWLTKKSLNGVEDSEVRWNFQKYLIDENGKLVKHFSSKTQPTDEDIISWIESR